MSAAVKLGSALGALMAAITFAFAEDVDWKMYGGASVDAPSFCFFDAKSVIQTDDGHIRVWTKCLPRKDVESVNDKSDRGRKLLEQSARQVVQGYMPPIMVTGLLESQDMPLVILYEKVADLGDVDPDSRIFLELNCSDKMERRLNTYIKYKGQMGFDEKPSAWSYVSPETNVARLQKMLCH